MKRLACGGHKPSATATYRGNVMRKVAFFNSVALTYGTLDGTRRPQNLRTPVRKPAPPPPPRSSSRNNLYNSDGKDPVEVYCRLRPLDNSNDQVCVRPISSNTVLVVMPDNYQSNRERTVRETQSTFKFVFDETTSQKALFDRVGLPLVSDLLNGKNGLLFTYGVTGSGKTFTMTGTPQDGGLLPRSLDVIFNSIKDIQARKYVFKPDKMNGFDTQCEADAMLDRQKDISLTNMRNNVPKTPRRKEQESEERFPDVTKIEGVDEDNNYAVFVCYIEIYNNYVYDLLDESMIDLVKPKPPQSKILREDPNHNMYVHGCTEVEVKSTDEAFDLFYRGQRRRRVAHTTLNTESSRSHSVFTIRLVQAPLDPLGQEIMLDKQAVVVSQLSLVDLAGSERTGRTQNKGDRLREAGSINNSLMVLRTCIEVLRENQTAGTNKMVPYRDSKMTHLFKNYFDGEGKVRMIVCVNPHINDYDENIHVMRFAEMTQEVQIARPVVAKVDYGLTPGRRRANIIFKEALEKHINADADISPPLLDVFSMGPPLLGLELLDPADEDSIKKLIDELTARKKLRTAVKATLQDKQLRFRAALLEMEKENTLMKREVEDLRAQIKQRDRKIALNENRLFSAEQANQSLQKRLNEYERTKKTLEYELDEKDMMLNQGKMEKEKLKARMQDKMYSDREKLAREMAKKVRENKTEMETQMYMNNAKLRALKSIVSDKWTPAGGMDVDKELKKKKIGAARSVSPPPVRSVPVANPRHRRSRSVSGDRWLEHVPAGNVDTGTLMQPKMKKRRSLNKLNVKDVIDGAVDRYVLSHQEQDNQGDVETYLYKGDIIPSAGGGAQVIFKDVEALRQLSPGDKKRTSSGASKDNVLTLDDVEMRCGLAVEGHAKKFKR